MNISVIIPAYNEESTILATLEDLLSNHHPEEVIVVDGGSKDKTVALVSEHVGDRVKLISSGKGRARQLNAGASEATGDVFLFLHADTRLPERALEQIKEAVRRGKEAGRFRMRFDRNHWLLRLYSLYTRFHLFSYGDQGFFVTRRLFSELGGYREDVPFEDVDFYQRLRKRTQPCILGAAVVTSARRFSQAGFLRQKLINVLLVSLSGAGVDISSLKEKLYPEIR